MPELRQNMATKRWVIIATERARRPEDFVGQPEHMTEDWPEWESDCPFCPGNEELDLEILRLPEEGPWAVRVVRNLYPALAHEGERTRSFDGIHRRVSAVGYHEVVVEAPLHNTCPALESPAQIALTLEAFRRRGWEIAQDRRVEQIVYFKNHGPSAGASLQHPHAQIIGLPIVPYQIRSRAEEARRYFDDTGHCAFCEMLVAELREEERIVVETPHFLAFIPYAAVGPFHTWVLPRRHDSSFLHIKPDELADLGAVLQSVLRRLYVGLKDPDYNYIIRSAPLRDPGTEYLHWYLTIVPRVGEAAGFELGSGMFINTALPEQSAAFLRAI